MSYPNNTNEHNSRLANLSKLSLVTGAKDAIPDSKQLSVKPSNKSESNDKWILETMEAEKLCRPIKTSVNSKKLLQDFYKSIQSNINKYTKSYKNKIAVNDCEEVEDLDMEH